MGTLITLLPLYILGNVHCLGMCGPLVMMLGQHRYWFAYFIGRILSYTLAGMIAGEMGAVLNLFLSRYHLSAIISFLFGGMIIFVGFYSLMNWSFIRFPQIWKPISYLSRLLSLLLLKEKFWPTWLFGFFTVALPCGQTLVVFSACALSGSAWVGMLNGFVFALLTSPSLLFALHAQTFLHKIKNHYNTLMGCCSLLVGMLACFRGFADLGLIDHFILNLGSNSYYHIVIY